MTLPIATKSVHMEAERAYLDAGPGPGRLELLSSNGTVLAQGALALPCGSTGGTDTLTLTAPVVLVAVAIGTPVSGRLVNGAGDVVRPGLTVGESDADVVLTYPAGSSAISQIGQIVSINVASIKHAE